MNWKDFDVLKIGRCVGTLEYRQETIDIAFTVEWRKRRSIHLNLEPIVISDHTIRLVERLYRGEKGDRRVPRFSIKAQTADSRLLTTDHARLKSYSGGGQIRPDIELGQVEIRSLDRFPAKGQESSPRVEYYSKGQLGFDQPTVTHDLGTVWLHGESKLSPDLSAYTGIVGIDGRATHCITDWLEESDRLVVRVLQMLSLAHGRQFYWEIRRVFVDEKFTSILVRPQPDPQNMRAALFHHLDLQPVLEMAVEEFTDELDERTGLGVAISWFLSVTASSESQFLHMMIALEHLVDVYSERSPSAAVVPKAFFKKVVRPKIIKALNELVGQECKTGNKFSCEHVGEIDRGMGNANRRSLESRLQQMLQSYGVEVADLEGDFRQLVQMRNAVVHQGLFRGSAEVERLRNIAEELLVRVFLTLLNHKGYYNSPVYDLKWRQLPRCS